MIKKRNTRMIDYFEQTEERKKITTLLKAGNFKKVSGRKKHSINIARNRIVMVALAVIIFIIGFFCVVF